jgi:hypothetical protein
LNPGSEKLKVAAQNLPRTFPPRNPSVSTTRHVPAELRSTPHFRALGSTRMFLEYRK